MGLGIGAIQNYLELSQQGYFDDIHNVIEMGSQELHIKAKDFEELIRGACIKNYKDVNFKNLDNWPGQPRCSSKYFYKMIGINEYFSIDLNGEFNSIPHNLNLPF